MRWIGGFAAILTMSMGCLWAQSEQKPVTTDQVMDQARTQLKLLLQNPKIVGFEGGVMGDAVKGAPYSAEDVRESTQVLGDGTRLHNQTKVAIYRDGEGRVRRESATEIEIWDPVAGIAYVLDPKSMTYHKMEVHIATRRTGDGTKGLSVYAFSTGSQPGAVAGGAAIGQQIIVRGSESGSESAETLPPLPELPGVTVNVIRKSTPGRAQKEKLPSRMIEGLNCEGERTTITIEAGAIGNDRPISSVSERWYSNDLQLAVMTSKTDPRTGEEKFTLQNIRRGEPDSSLFQVPAGYQPDGPIKF